VKLAASVPNFAVGVAVAAEDVVHAHVVLVVVVVVVVSAVLIYSQHQQIHSSVPVEEMGNKETGTDLCNQLSNRRLATTRDTNDNQNSNIHLEGK